MFIKLFVIFHIYQVISCFLIYFQTFFDDVVLESDKDKRNIIKEIEELLVEKDVLEKVSLYFVPIFTCIY